MSSQELRALRMRIRFAVVQRDASGTDTMVRADAGVPAAPSMREIARKYALFL